MERTRKYQVEPDGRPRNPCEVFEWGLADDSLQAPSVPCRDQISYMSAPDTGSQLTVIQL